MIIRQQLQLHTTSSYMIGQSMLRLKKHFIKEKLEVGLICMPYISIDQQVADILREYQKS